MITYPQAAKPGLFPRRRDDAGGRCVTPRRHLLFCYKGAGGAGFRRVELGSKLGSIQGFYPDVTKLISSMIWMGGRVV